MLFEYKCRDCGQVYETTIHRGPDIGRCQTEGCTGTATRKFSISVAPVMQEHFNKTVGKPISDMKQFTRELRKKGEDYTRETGIETNYVPVDMNDHESLGVTAEGLESTNRRRRSEGLPAIRV